MLTVSFPNHITIHSLMEELPQCLRDGHDSYRSWLQAAVVAQFIRYWKSRPTRMALIKECFGSPGRLKQYRERCVDISDLTDCRDRLWSQ